MSLWRLSSLQKEQVATETFLVQLDAGAQPPRRAIRAITKDRKIQELKDRFELNTISLDEYVRGMSAHTNI